MTAYFQELISANRLLTGKVITLEKKMDQLLNMDASEEEPPPHTLDSLEELEKLEIDLDDKAYMAMMVRTYQIYVHVSWLPCLD